MHYYQKNIGDYRRDTMHLTALEHGIYNLFLDTYYLSEQPLSSDHANLMRTHCLRTADEVSAAENVLRDFFILSDDGYVHKRCDVEIEAFHGKSKSASESAKARWERVRCERNANALNSHCEGNANHKPLTINQEPIKSKPLVLADSVTLEKAKVDPVPYEKIVNLYHQTLPTLPRVVMLTAKRKGQIAARWRSGVLPDIETWGEFFTMVGDSPFLTGKLDPPEGRKRFVADLEWVTNESNFTKIWEGKYHGSR